VACAALFLLEGIGRSLLRFPALRPAFFLTAPRPRASLSVDCRLSGLRLPWPPGPRSWRAAAERAPRSICLSVLGYSPGKLPFSAVLPTVLPAGLILFFTSLRHLYLQLLN